MNNDQRQQQAQQPGSATAAPAADGIDAVLCGDEETQQDEEVWGLPIPRRSAPTSVRTAAPSVKSWLEDVDKEWTNPEDAAASIGGGGGGGGVLTEEIDPNDNDATAAPSEDYGEAVVAAFGEPVPVVADYVDFQMQQNPLLAMMMNNHPPIVAGPAGTATGSNSSSSSNDLSRGMMSSDGVLSHLASAPDTTVAGVVPSSVPSTAMHIPSPLPVSPFSALSDGSASTVRLPLPRRVGDVSPTEAVVLLATTLGPLSVSPVPTGTPESPVTMTVGSTTTDSSELFPAAADDSWASINEYINVYIDDTFVLSFTPPRDEEGDEDRDE